MRNDLIEIFFFKVEIDIWRVNVMDIKERSVVEAKGKISICDYVLIPPCIQVASLAGVHICIRWWTHDHQ